jgi:hypothetical protein
MTYIIKTTNKRPKVQAIVVKQLSTFFDVPKIDYHIVEQVLFPEECTKHYFVLINVYYHSRCR